MALHKNCSPAGTKDDFLQISRGVRIIGTLAIGTPSEYTVSRSSRNLWYLFNPQYFGSLLLPHQVSVLVLVGVWSECV